MARIVELKQYDNVTLCRGVMQNWVDLDVDGPSWKPLVVDLVSDVSGRVLVVGPHDPRLLSALSERVEQLVVVVRAAQDAGTIATAVPVADVRAGNLTDCIRAGERFDVVIMLDDLSRVLSAEDDDRSWAELAEEVFACAEPGGKVYFALENERGLHRNSGTIDTYAVNLDRDWTPFRTWDGTRPRTVAQLESWLDGAGRGEAAVWGMYPSLRGVNALTATRSQAPQVRDLAAAYALRGWASPLPLRSAALADLMPEVAAGWIVCVGVSQVVDAVTSSADGATRTWRVEGADLFASDGTQRTLPVAGRTALIELIEMAADGDTPGMRALLRRWHDALLAGSSNGRVPAALADARLSNVYVSDVGGVGSNDDIDGTGVVFLEPAATSESFEKVVWSALADALSVIQVHGLKHPWSNAMNRQTRLAALGAMAGAQRPADLTPYLSDVKDRGQTREELLAVIKRQQDELKSVWARWRWDEKQYATFVAKSNVKKSVRYAKKHGKNLPKEATKRVAKKAQAQLKK